MKRKYLVLRCVCRTSLGENHKLLTMTSLYIHIQGWQYCIMGMSQIVLCALIYHLQHWTSQTRASQLYRLARRCANKGIWTMNRALRLVGVYDDLVDPFGWSTLSSVGLMTFSLFIPSMVRNLALWNVHLWTMTQCTDDVHNSSQQFLHTLQHCTEPQMVEQYVTYFKMHDLRRIQRICTYVPAHHPTQRYYQCITHALNTLRTWIRHHHMESEAPEPSPEWILPTTSKCTPTFQFEVHLLQHIHTIQPMFLPKG